MLLPVLLLTANISLANNELAPKIQIELYHLPGMFNIGLVQTQACSMNLPPFYNTPVIGRIAVVDQTFATIAHSYAAREYHQLDAAQFNFISMVHCSG